MRFSERHGLVPVRSVVQIESMDDALRKQLWNVTHDYYVGSFSMMARSDHLYAIWTDLMEREVDQFNDRRFPDEVKAWILTNEWYLVYDLIEAFVALDHSANAVKAFNDVLERYLAGYRVVAGQVVPIADDHELSEIEVALTAQSHSVAHHLQNALRLLADRAQPDYPNSIKESISAVEAFLAPVTGEQTLGAAVKKLKRIGGFTHPALLDAWSKFYGWTSDENGIRHGGDSVPSELITQALARYVLISCSAFINLLTAEQAAGRIPLADK
ncbi:AbiJ-NTD4 domain-containing protein [Nocardia sp. NPDC087230]|uniref:AbiJ-NTD4 domain-containing protein n=1 Tax=Nocardia sp. NPDC087230 TaxID=3364331 RepID=UPI003802D310